MKVLSQVKSIKPYPHESNIKLPAFFCLTACNKLISDDIATRFMNLMLILMLIVPKM